MKTPSGRTREFRRQSMMPALALLAVLGISPTSSAAADSAPEWVFRGGSPVAESGTRTEVEMTEEWVRLTNLRPHTSPGGFGDWLVDIEATFLFTNTGKESERIKMWFPLCDVLPNGEGSHCQVNEGRDTSVTFEGQPLAFTAKVPVPPADPDWESTTAKLRFDADFPAGEQRTLVVRYVAVSYNNRDKGPSWPVGFEYVLHTGAGWKGPIGMGTISLDLPYPARPYNVQISNDEIDRDELDWAPPTPVPVTYAGNRITYAFEDLEPTTDNDLFFAVLLPPRAKRLEQDRDAAQADPTYQSRLALASSASFALARVPGANDAFNAAVAELLPRLNSERYRKLRYMMRKVDRAAAANRDTECKPSECANYDLIQYLRRSRGLEPALEEKPSEICCWDDHKRNCDVPGGACEGERTPPEFTAVIRATWGECLQDGTDCDSAKLDLWENAVALPASARAADTACWLGLPQSALPELEELLQKDQPDVFWDGVGKLISAHVRDTKTLRSGEAARDEDCPGGERPPTKAPAAPPVAAAPQPPARLGKVNSPTPTAVETKPGETDGEMRTLAIAGFAAMIVLGLVILVSGRRSSRRGDS